MASSCTVFACIGFSCFVLHVTPFIIDFSHQKKTDDSKKLVCVWRFLENLVKKLMWLDYLIWTECRWAVCLHLLCVSGLYGTRSINRCFSWTIYRIPSLCTLCYWCSSSKLMCHHSLCRLEFGKIPKLNNAF